MKAIALALPPGPAPAWVDAIVRALRDSPTAEPVGVLEAPPPGTGKPSPRQRLYAALDRRLFDLGPDDALARGEGLADSLPRLDGTGGRPTVDVVLDLTLLDREPDRGPLPHEAWTIRAGAADGTASLAEAFAAPLDCYSVSLRVRAAGAAEDRLAGVSVGRLDEISPRRNLSRACWRAAALVERHLSTLAPCG